MSKWDESHTEPIHDTPAEKDVLIRAMEAAGYMLDTIESTDDHLRFFGEGGQTMTMAGWHETEYARLMAEKKQTFAEYRKTRDEVKEYLIVRENIASLYEAERKENEADRKRQQEQER